MTNIGFAGRDGIFTLENAENITGLYLPLAGERGLKSAVTPNLGGDSKIDQNTFLLEPVSIENLHSNRGTRNFWCRMADGSIWSVCGASAAQESEKFGPKQEKSRVTGGFLWQALEREGAQGLYAKTESFVTVRGEQEAMLVTLVNRAAAPLTFTPVAAVPLYGRSADNLRDHRHVTSLLHRIRVTSNGVIVKPSLSFDERGHRENEMLYFAAANGPDGALPIAIYPTAEMFLGEGGTFLNPEAVRSDKPGTPAGTLIEGREAMGAMAFDAVTLAPGESTQYVVRFGLTQEAGTLPALMNVLDTPVKAAAALEEVRQHWQKLVNVEFATGDSVRDNYLKWVCFQPILRRIFGCSFLPYHDYGKGGRGWRDLWQDCLALLIMDPGDVRGMIVDNYGGVRMDGTNATIIGEKQGEFVADRNNITRVWMDHAFWPLVTTEFYLNQTGDFSVLLEKAPYFKDRQIRRGMAHDDMWQPADGSRQRTADGTVYEGTVLEHILLENLCAFYDVGAHNELRLHNADWNDALDMAADKGESVAFTNAYAGNLHGLVKILQKLGAEKITVAQELTALLGHEDIFDDPTAKNDILSRYEATCAHANSGRTVELDTAALMTDLTAKANWMQCHIRETEWVTDGKSGWLNGYYDNHGQPVEGVVNDLPRMMLPSQVFGIMYGTTTAEQTAEICRSADRYLFEEKIGGYRLNTNFKEKKLDLGRMFGFAYGEKENGAVFSHMTVMYANALYQRGFAKEGAKALDTLLNTAMDFAVSKMYPGLPEYFNNDGRGLYPYLTGAASWYMLTEICWVYGVRGEWGDLVIAPALQKAQFGGGSVSVTLPFAGRTLRVRIENADGIEQKDYRVYSAALDGTALPVAEGILRIPRAEIEALTADAIHEITVILHA